MSALLFLGPGLALKFAFGRAFSFAAYALADMMLWSALGFSGELPLRYTALLVACVAASSARELMGTASLARPSWLVSLFGAAAGVVLPLLIEALRSPLGAWRLGWYGADSLLAASTLDIWLLLHFAIFLPVFARRLLRRRLARPAYPWDRR